MGVKGPHAVLVKRLHGDAAVVVGVAGGQVDVRNRGAARGKPARRAGGHHDVGGQSLHRQVGGDGGGDGAHVVHAVQLALACWNRRHEGWWWAEEGGGRSAAAPARPARQ